MDSIWMGVAVAHYDALRYSDVGVTDDGNG